jgi:hypothetical protein
MSGTLCSIKRRNVHVQTCNLCDDLAMFGGGQPVFAQAAISEPGAYAFYHPDADVLNAGRPTFSDSANASASERDSRIDGHARMQQILSRHHRRLSAVDARSTD